MLFLSNLSKSNCGSEGKRAREERTEYREKVKQSEWFIRSLLVLQLWKPDSLIWQMGSMLNILLDSRSVAVSIKFHSLQGRPIHSGVRQSFQWVPLSKPILLDSWLGNSQYLFSILSVIQWGLAIRKSLSQAQFVLGNFHSTSYCLFINISRDIV